MRSSFRFKAMNVIHRVVLAVSGGRLGWTAMDMPVLELTTTGRKSGQPHSVMLTSPLQEGAVFVVVASGGGDLRPPAWFLNLRDNPTSRSGCTENPGTRCVLASPPRRSARGCGHWSSLPTTTMRATRARPPARSRWRSSNRLADSFGQCGQPHRSSPAGGDEAQVSRDSRRAWGLARRRSAGSSQGSGARRRAAGPGFRRTRAGRRR
jgi:deazaflavin-dependent oxidoreductase (nitroreductase family)